MDAAFETSAGETSDSGGEGFGESLGAGHLCGIGCCGAVTFTGLILFLCSFQGLNATEFGLTKNKVTGVVNLDEVYYGGRNAVGFWNQYITFPATIQSITWSASSAELGAMDARANDGLMVKLSISAQYTINRDRVGEIYRNYKENVQGFFVSNMRSKVAEIISDYPSHAMWERRNEVIASLKQACDRVCQAEDSLKGMVSCWGIQFLGVTVDANLENTLEQNQVENQKQAMQAEVQKANVIRASITVTTAHYDARIGVITAQATADAYQVSQHAESNAKLAWLEAKAGALTTIHDTVVASGGTKMTNAEVISYLERTTIAEDTTAPMIYGDYAKGVKFTKEL